MSRKREKGIDRRFALEAVTIRNGLQTDEPQRNRTPRRDDRWVTFDLLDRTNNPTSNVRSAVVGVVILIAAIMLAAAK